MKGKSLNPSDRKIRAYQVEEMLRRTRKGVHELFPSGADLNEFLNKPADRLAYYSLSKCTVNFVCR